jgi:ESS family glutamate:Na+ symporter
MTMIPVDPIEMLGIAIIVLFLGVFLTLRIPFLKNNFIPAAVTGGILTAAFVWLLRDGFGIAFEFDMSPRDLLLLVFFSTVGLSVKFSTLVSGGKTLPLLVVAAGVFLVLQNTVGVGIAMLLGADPVYGLMAGSISFAGGHGTSIAWGTDFEASGLAGASTIGLAFSTFGLVSGGLIGGPIAGQLIKRFSVKTDRADQNAPVVIESEEASSIDEPRGERQWLFDVMTTLFLLAVCVSLGDIVNRYASDYGVKVPGFLTAMFVGILLNNVTGVLRRPAAAETVNRFGTVSLHLFLAMSMMSVELWTLGGAFQAITLVLFAQVLLMTVFAMLVIFFIAGRDYDAVVIAAGFSGLGLGATPVAIANMTAVTSTYGPSPKAMLLVPLIGAFFIDLLNAGTIQFFLRILS